MSKLNPKLAGRQALEMNLQRADLFYYAGIMDTGPLVRKGIVLEVDGVVALVDNWDYVEGQWSDNPFLLDLTRLRYIGAAKPEPVKEAPTEEPPIPQVDTAQVEEFAAEQKGGET